MVSTGYTSRWPITRNHVPFRRNLAEKVFPKGYRMGTEWISNGNGTNKERKWMTKMEKAFSRMQAIGEGIL